MGHIAGAGPERVLGCSVPMSARAISLALDLAMVRPVGAQPSRAWTFVLVGPANESRPDGRAVFPLVAAPLPGAGTRGR